LATHPPVSAERFDAQRVQTTQSTDGNRGRDGVQSRPTDESEHDDSDLVLLESFR
jgi:hypothetical protein